MHVPCAQGSHEQLAGQKDGHVLIRKSIGVLYCSYGNNGIVMVTMSNNVLSNNIYVLFGLEEKRILNFKRHYRLYNDRDSYEPSSHINFPSEYDSKIKIHKIHTNNTVKFYINNFKEVQRQNPSINNRDMSKYSRQRLKITSKEQQQQCLFNHTMVKGI
ncbi:hypothetical protein FF38_13473 [Lucilia cuprina]|uniref:Uncharacterized protein n=1 Tax=Lucilia cuprina TaxID=7375 RepID=A0A0L0BR40_LUCCU|nr:hypothetical protein FF38_13473 [Lucilia cuprina]